MKKLHELILGAAMTLFALTACNDEGMTSDVPQGNGTDNPEYVYLSADDFRWEGSGSRTSVSIGKDCASFLWTAGDLVGILPDQGAQVYSIIPEPEEGEEMTNKASFDGGAWSLRPQNNYAAYYPFVEDFHLERTKIPVGYTGQKQKGTTSDHIGAYDYMGARPVMTNELGAGVIFDFDHVGALVLLRFTVPDAGTRLNSVTLSADGVKFITKGTYSLASTREEGFPIIAKFSSEKMTVQVDYTTATANEEVTVYMMCAPIDLSGKTVNLSVDCADNVTLEFMAAGKKLEAGCAYTLTAEGQPNSVKSVLKVDDEALAFSRAIDRVLGQFSGVNKLRFVTRSNTTSEMDFYEDLYGVKAYAVVNGDWLEVHTEAKAFKLPEHCSNMFDVDYLENFDSLIEMDLNGFDTSEVTLMEYMFYGYSSLTSLNLSSFDTSAVTDMDGMFSNCTLLASLDLSSFDTSEVEKMSSMFFGCSSLVSLDLSGFDTGNVTEMYRMFDGCFSLTSLDLSKFNTSKVKDMSCMFSDCSSLVSLDLSKFNTSKVKDMSHMFSDCSSLVSLDLSKFNTSKVEEMNHMFSGCSSLVSLDLSKFSTSAVSEMDYMFSDCSSLTSLDLSKFNTSAVNEMDYMFSGCSSLVSLDLSKFNTSAVSEMDYMFSGCTSLTSLDLRSFTFTGEVYCENMFEEVGKGAKKITSIYVTGTGKNYLEGQATGLDSNYAKLVPSF